MLLPSIIQEKVNRLFAGMNKESLVAGREELTRKYKTNQAINRSVFESKNDSAVYAISRMPATFSVIYSLLDCLTEQKKIENISSVIDIGSGTGAGFFACREFFGDIKISLFERDKNMIEVFNELETGESVTKFDILTDMIGEKADLVMSSYVFSELNDAGRKTALEKMLDCSNRFVLIVDTGTPRTYENFMRVKQMVHEMGYAVTAPCESEKCGLKNDYCQFYTRVERSGLLKLSKNGELPYEDEKYFYLLIDKQAKLSENFKERRVIRRPILKTNFVELKLCTKDGVKLENITKKDKETYQKARKIKVNETI